ncbi:hypothetical protein Psch_02197 [Pelotomaculum schinkii]|uniref:DNA repair protein RadA n=1 Tax=Pelotomaculum schinkii TaxID=78350 RepID=A0A4Y7RIK5_9FIRM|nr:bifunctional DNA primase/polymerase [Pelotomaculum schinkii]TEB08631.1 hypothetical protein Psch_02197 [Pelotomaculum schinkii]
MDQKIVVLEAALAHAGRGYPVFPLWWPLSNGRCVCGDPKCASVGKHPIEKGWQELATTSEATILKWWQRWPKANIGIPTGERSGILLLDVDLKGDGPDHLAELEAMNGALPETVEAITGSGGRHILFRYPTGRAIPNKARFHSGLDTRSDGGLFVAPGSLHVNGRRYEWETEHHPDDVPLAEAPEWLLRLMEVKPKGNAAPPVDEYIAEGSRNAVLTSLGGTMRRRGMSQEAIEAALMAENEKRCLPSLGTDEVRKIAESVCRYNAEVKGQPTCESSDKAKSINLNLLLTKPDLNKNVEIPMILPGIFPRGYVTLLVGDPKSGKTWLALRLACELSKGGSILAGFSSVVPCRVLYLMGDTGPQLVNYRLRKTKFCFDPNNLRFTYAEDVRQQGADLDLGTSEGFTLLEMLMVSWEPQVVFIDTLTSFHAVDESDNKEMKPVVSKMRDLAMRSNAAIVLLHHTRKKKRSELSMSMTQHDSVGAGVLARLVGNVVGVEKKLGEDGSPFYLVRSLASWFKEFSPFSFTLEDETDESGQEWVRMPIDLTPEVGKDARETIQRIIDLTYWDGSSFTRQDICNKTGLSHGPVSQILNELVKEGRLIPRGSTRNKSFAVPLDIVDMIP